MNQEKAREFFSPYHEGTLEAGLQQTLENSLRRDPDLREEFRGFERTYDELGKLKFEVVEIPFDLNQRIMSRVDRHVQETRRNVQPTWTVWARNLAFTGVAAAAIVGALLSLRPGSSDTAIAGALVTPTREEISISLVNGTPTVEFSSADRKTVVIREGIDGTVLQKVALTGDTLRSPLRNTGESAIVFSINVVESGQTTLVAVPGHTRSGERKGEGSLVNFAQALAEVYGSPVLVQAANTNHHLTWDLTGTDPITAAAGALDSQRYSVEKRQSGLICVLEE